MNVESTLFQRCVHAGHSYFVCSVFFYFFGVATNCCFALSFHVTKSFFGALARLCFVIVPYLGIALVMFSYFYAQ